MSVTQFRVQDIWYNKKNVSNSVQSSEHIVATKGMFVTQFRVQDIIWWQQRDVCDSV